MHRRTAATYRDAIQGPLEGQAASIHEVSRRRVLGNPEPARAFKSTLSLILEICLLELSDTIRESWRPAYGEYTSS